MKLQQFKGGLNTKDSAHLIATNEATQYENIDNEGGELKPCKALLIDGPSFPNYDQNDRYIRHLDAITNLVKTPQDLVEYQDKIYYSVENDFVQMKDVLGTVPTEGDLGLDPPIIANISLITTVIPIPEVADITISEDGDTFTVVPWVFSKDVLYNFAFIKIDADGNQSNPLFIDFTPLTNTSLDITVPYDHLIHLRVGGVWKRLLTTFLYASPFWGVGNPEPFLANITYEILLSDFSFITIFFVDTSVEVDLVPLDTSLAVAGTYIYVATTGIFNLGWESEPSNLVTALITDSQLPELIITQGIDEQGNPLVDSRVDRLYIYRLGNTITDFTLVTTIEDPNPLFPITYVDRDPDTNVAGNKILDTEDYDKPLSGLKNLVVINGQLVGSIGSKLYFSVKGKLFAIPPANYRDFRDTITGLFDIDAGLIICSVDRTWLLNTSNIATGKALPISAEFGCTSHLTMAGVKTGAIWNSRVGICVSFGGKVELVSKKKLGFNALNITHGFMHHETYYGFAADGTCYALDLRYNTAIKTFNFKLFNDSDATTVIQQLYTEDGKLKTLFGSPSTDAGVPSVIDSYEVFGAAIFETLIWKSPNFIEGSYTDIKTYKDIYIYAEGLFTVRVYIDDKLVNTTSIRKLDNYHIKVEQENHQGFFIRFEVEGQGTIYEIEYKAMGSQDGR